MAAWPGGLPQGHLLGLDYGDVGDAMIRTPTDGGPAKQRRRYASDVVTFSERVVFTETEYDTFLTFYRTTLANGTDAFDRTDPRDNTVRSMRFRKPAPRFRMQLNKGGRVWLGNLDLEILPT